MNPYKPDLKPCIFGNVLSFFSGSKQILIDKKYAHAIADWIKANVPEEPPRDREGDMKKLADKVLRVVDDNPDKSLLYAIWGASNFQTPDGEPGYYDQCVINILGIDDLGIPSKRNDHWLAYSNELIRDLPGWIRDRALGTGGD